jgi:biopolymer transport protein ExbD
MKGAMKDFVSAPLTPRKSLLDRVEDALLPLINLVFLLLMFFIVAGQMQNRALPTLPGTAGDTGSDRPQADLVVVASGDWQVEGQTVTATNLARYLPDARSKPSLTVGADAGTSMKDLESLFSTLADAGYADVVLLTEPAGS